MANQNNVDVFEQFQQYLQVIQQLQQLQAPARAREKEARTKEDTMERLLLSLQERREGRPKAKADLPGLSALQSRFGAASGRTAELALDVDQDDPESVKAFREKAALQNAQEGDFFRAMGQALLQKGDSPLAQMAFQLADSVDPPTPEVIRKRNVRARKAQIADKKRRTGTFSVTGGPRSGFKGVGTPEEILHQLISTRSPELKKKFGQTSTDAHPVTPPKNKVTTKKKKKPGKSRIIFGRNMPEDQITRDPVVEAFKFFFGQQESDLRARRQFFGGHSAQRGN